MAHCLLNPYTRVRGLGPVGPLPSGPIIQLPCPEALFFGLDRWAVTKNQLDYPEYRRFCRELIMPVADMLEMLSRKGARIGAVGVVGSPSCGVSTTSVGYLGGRVQEAEHLQVSGRGIFMEELASELCIRKIAVDWGEVANLPPGSEQLGSG